MAKRLGVIGSLVWDVIHGRDPARGPVEEWGGIAYTLAGLDAALTADWEIVPLIKVGRDMSGRAARFLASLRRRAPTARFLDVPAPNNQVVLHYATAGRRCERMAGGVPGWTWAELGPLVHDLDALYVNFISGFELDLGTAEALRTAFPGPIFADLHSLFLGMRQDGLRVLQPLDRAPDWFRCFDTFQLNEDEMRQVGDDPLAVAAEAMRTGVSLLTVTLGARGVAYVAAPGFHTLADRTRSGLAGHAPGEPLRTALVPAIPVPDPDPTGCGDVFGAVLAARLLAGDPVEAGIAAAIPMASRNAALRGATDLAARLRGELVETPCMS